MLGAAGCVAIACKQYGVALAFIALKQRPEEMTNFNLSVGLTDRFMRAAWPGVVEAATLIGSKQVQGRADFEPGDGARQIPGVENHMVCTGMLGHGVGVILSTKPR